MAMPMRSLLAILATIGLALPASARYEFTAVKNHVPVPESEVCFYPTGGFDNPIADLSTTTVRCYPSDTLLDLPAGQFGYFMRNLSSRLVSAHHGLLRFEEQSTEEGYRQIKWPVVDAAELRIDAFDGILAADDHLALVIGATEENRPAVYPVPRNESRLLVPIGVTFVPVWMRGTRPLRVGAAITVDASDENPALSFPSGDSTCLITSAAIEEENPPASKHGCKTTFSNEFLDILEGVPPPGITLAVGGGQFEPVLPVVHAANLNPTVLIFKDLPSGEGKLQIRGRTWEASTRSVTIRPGVNVVPSALTTHMRSGVEVHWAVPHGVLRSGQDCTNSTTDVAAEVVLARCSGSVCDDEASADIRVNEQRGVVRFSGLRAGMYRIFLRTNDKTWATEEVNAELGSIGSVTVEPTGIHSIFGRVTLNGAPVHAMLQFRGGSTVTSETTGDYYIPLAEPPGRASVKVTLCDGSLEYKHKPTGPLPADERLDIEIPGHFVTVLVKTADGAGKAMVVSFTVVDPEPLPNGQTQSLYSLTGTTNDDGTIRLGPLPLGARGEACTYIPRACSEQLTIRRTEESATISIGDAEAEGLVSPRGYEHIFWIAADGSIVDDRIIEPDGRFDFTNEKTGPAVVLVSRHLPIYAGPTPFVSRTDSRIELQVPAAPVRSLRVILGPNVRQRNAFVALRVGAIRIPTQALLMHQARRQEPYLILDRRPLAISDVLLTEPLSVILGPDPELLAFEVPPGSDIMGIPSVLAAAPIFPVRADGDLVIGE